MQRENEALVQGPTHHPAGVAEPEGACGSTPVILGACGRDSSASCSAGLRESTNEGEDPDEVTRKESRQKTVKVQQGTRGGDKQRVTGDTSSLSPPRAMGDPPFVPSLPPPRTVGDPFSAPPPPSPAAPLTEDMLREVTERVRSMDPRYRPNPICCLFVSFFLFVCLFVGWCTRLPEWICL